MSGIFLLLVLLLLFLLVLDAIAIDVIDGGIVFLMPLLQVAEANTFKAELRNCRN